MDFETGLPAAPFRIAAGDSLRNDRRFDTASKPACEPPSQHSDDSSFMIASTKDAEFAALLEQRAQAVEAVLDGLLSPTIGEGAPHACSAGCAMAC